MASASLCKLLYILVLVCISSGGILSQPCGLSSIQVNQHSTGAREGLDQEFVVEIKNACTCTQMNVRVYAPGFASQKPVDPTMFRPSGGAFIVNGGNPIPAGSTVKFAYWWDRPGDQLLPSKFSGAVPLERACPYSFSLVHSISYCLAWTK